MLILDERNSYGDSASMVRPDERRAITRIHEALLGRIQNGPVLDGELAELYGSKYIEIVGDLMANDIPIWKEQTDWEDLTINIYYYEAPGQEKAFCVSCNSKIRALGPFCSAECESRFISNAMSDWKKRKSERKVNTAATDEKARKVEAGVYKPSTDRRVFGGMRLSNIVPAATIIHLSKKALFCKKLDQTERNAISYIGGRMYRNEMLTETEKKILDSTLEKAIQAGIATDPCPNGECERCRKLVEILSAHDVLKKSV